MNLNDLQFREISTSSLSKGSVFSQEDLSFYSEGSGSLNFPFGKLDTDRVCFSVYDLENNLLSFSLVDAGGKYTAFTQSFTDVNSRQVTYNYETFISNWGMFGSPTSSLFIDVTKQMNSFGLANGNYVMTIELVRDLVGSKDGEQLVVDTISTGRDEIALIPKTLAGSNSNIASDMAVFGKSQFKVKEIAQQLLDSIAAPQFYTEYFKAVKADPTGSAALKFYYGFTAHGSGSAADFDVVCFLTDIYYGVQRGKIRADGTYAPYDILGIYDQFKNWLYLNYNEGATFEDVRNYYFSLFRYVIDVELNHLTNRKPDEYDVVLAFLQKIYFDAIFLSNQSNIETAYNDHLNGYFKTELNIGNETYFVMNRKIVASTDPLFNDSLVLKLDRPLSLEITEGASAWITNNFGFQPVVQNLYFFTLPSHQTVQLRGPNFTVLVESQGNATEAVSMEELVAQTDDAYSEIVSKIGARTSGSIDNTDYRNFGNFVTFSSATMRVAGYNWKQARIQELKAEIASLDLKVIENPSDTYYVSERSDASREIDEIEARMDGYEWFLYNNSHWVGEHEASASLYDKENGNSLINNLPEFIVNDSENNSDYITFVGMIGHFFDNISIAVKQLTEKNNYSSSPNYGISIDVVYDMLASLGWDAEISKDNLPLLLASFSKQDFDPDSPLYSSSNTFSEEERNKIIWKRLINALPYLYKTKGTEAGLNALITCFGIPKNIVKIKEFGGIHNKANLQDTSLYVIDEVKYEPYFSGSGEYFSLNWTGSATTVEFTFAFDPSKTSTKGEVFRLANCSNKWVIGAYREKGLDWGRLFFSLDNGSGVTKTIMTEKAPIFDGATYHAMLRRADPAEGYNLVGATHATIDTFPACYDLMVQKAQDARVVFSATGSIFLSGSYNTNFRAGTNVFFGNYQQNTASLNVDPEAFFGNIDEIKIWQSPVNDERFENHTLHQSAYDLDTPEQMVSDNLWRVSFERPIDLYDSGSVVTLTNLAFRRDFPTFTAVNFPRAVYDLVRVTECDPISGSQFPYQFVRKDTRQTVKLPDYGANRFNSNKVNYVEQALVSNLSPSQRASMQSSELVSVGSNRLGVFFSPSENLNMEIIKFFGDYPLTDLIGDPAAIYESSYKKFNKFKELFYAQGYGIVDYQFFMNIVRFYFDKAMLKYIRGMIPARAKLIDGILIEPSILERPKIALKPLKQEVIQQNVAGVNGKPVVAATSAPRLAADLALRDHGYAIYNDVNHVSFPAIEDKLGFGVMADNTGLAFYNGAYYRADVIEIGKKYQVYNKHRLDTSASLSETERYLNHSGEVSTVTKKYKTVSIAKLPEATSYPFTMSFANGPKSFYLSGSVSFNVATQGTGLAYQVILPHSFNGMVTGSISGHDPRTNSGSLNEYKQASVLSTGLVIQATSELGSGSSVVFGGKFSTGSNGTQYFEGSVSYQPQTASFYPGIARWNATVYSTDASGSIFDLFRTRIAPTTSSLFAGLGAGLTYRKELSMMNYPSNGTLLLGYHGNHYKYTLQHFSQKVVNSYDQNNSPVKWKRGSQTKKTTVDGTSGLFDGSDPVESKRI